MTGKNDILQELRSLSELVASISRQTPYRVADDYFTDLPTRMILQIKTKHKPMAFNVPEGYFEGFAEGLLARIKAGAGSGMTASATAPESAAQELAALSPLLVQLSALATYQMPEGYLQELSPILTVARDLNPYTVPEAYFHQLPTEVSEKLLEPQVESAPAKVISLGGRRTNWWKYSAAAVVAGLILTIGWLRLHVPGGDHPKSVDVASNLVKVSDQDLQSFLAVQDTTLAQPVNNIAALDFNDNDVRSLLGDIPDGELKQYMDEHGGTDDIATN